MTIPELTHDDAQTFDIDNITHHGTLIDQRIEYDGPTVTLELPARAAFDIITATDHLLETWTDDKCADDAYMRHAMCYIATEAVEQTKASGHSDLEALTEWSLALDEIRPGDP